jgi:hypothetical protein
MPTFSSLAGVPLPSDRAIDGRDISALISAETPTPAKFYYQGFMRAELVAIRDGDWKLKLPRKGYPKFLNPVLKLDAYSHGLLLFNLADDPSEKHNIASDFPERVERMRNELLTMQAKIDADQERILLLKPAAVDRKGYGPLFAKIIALGITALFLLILVLRWLYKVVRRKLSSKKSNQANSA